ncbi:glycosyltransferase [Bradyrhizobium sp. NC92]|uniref:glycosyltransferase n=1 Tax=Bradyrhizobium sp. (strain NC92) TaxID=55395 RepID=UPI0021AAAF5E|nr:glycosyltransferase [Bradyrhizobium sp. NC92]UWU67625.1 glycosyltransferase [Bradyrhizobium sp. NC92]
MNILHIISSADLRTGGPIQGIVATNPLLIERGHRRVLVTLDSLSDAWIADFPVPLVPLGVSHKKSWRWLPWVRYRYSPHLLPWLRNNVSKFDAVVVNGLWNYSSFAARLALRRSATPYFVYTHGMLDPWFRKAYPLKHIAKQLSWWLSEGPLLSGAHRVIFTTDEERVLARNAFWPYRVKDTVVGYGTTFQSGDIARQKRLFRAYIPALGDRPFILFLSRVHPKKGCDLLVQAFGEVADKFPELDLVIAGPDQVDWIPKLQAQAEAAGIANRIHWPGMLSGDLKWGAFHACEAFILPSHQENFGIVVAEALACSRPVLISNKVNIWREVSSNGAGWVAHDDLSGTLELLNKFCTMTHTEKANMQDAARATFLMHFDMNKNIDQFIQLLKT